MAYQALYRKYRPTTFSEVVGQEHITETLKNQLDSNKLVHAYLFTGTRGTGKTSCAKILAKAINCQNPQNGDPCGECEMCKNIAADEVTDIIEIDAASNNGVDNIRELREQANFAPTTAKYRVYIIDEVHMLSQSAFNALLKTLEEPPKHVVFILATTEVHKLPATILSRCQRYDFRRISPERICDRIKEIAVKEGLDIEDEAMSLIASAADGGMRDALSILDLCASSNTHITEDTVANVCAMAGKDYLIKLADYIAKSDTENALLLIDGLHNSSVDMIRLLADLTKHFRDLLIVKTVKGKNKPIVCSNKHLAALEKQAEDFEISKLMYALGILQNSSSVMQTANRRCEMEMAIIKLCNPKLVSDTSALEIRISELERLINSGNLPAKPPKSKSAEPLPKAEKAEVKTEMPIQEENFETENAGEEPIKEWKSILEILKTSCPLIYGVLGDSKAYIKGEYLLIDTKSSQFKNLINGTNPLYKDSIRKAAQDVLGVTYKLGPYRKPTKVSADVDPLAAFAERIKNLEEK